MELPTSIPNSASDRRRVVSIASEIRQYPGGRA